MSRDLSGKSAIVTGASRGFGRAAAISLSERGAHVVGVARNEDAAKARADVGWSVSHPSLVDEFRDGSYRK